MARVRRQSFAWRKRTEKSAYSTHIDGIDQSTSVLKAEFSNSIIGEESNFKVRLDNNNEAFVGKYSGNEIVDFYLDFTDGTTKWFSGKIEKLRKEFGEFGRVLVLEGNHRYHSELLDITVTEEFSGVAGDNVLKSLISTYLSGYTTTNIASTTVTITKKWENVPFYDAVVDICNLCGFDSYIDTDADWHFFKRESITVINDAIVQGVNLISVEGLTDDIVDVRNKVQTISEDSEGLPILYTSENSASQSTYGIKEQIIKDTNIATEGEAKEVADAIRQDSPESRGSATSFFLPFVTPGGFMWIVDPPDIHAQYRIVKITHKIPNQITNCVIAKSKNLPTFLKERKQREAGLERLKNPFKMKWTYNFNKDTWADNVDTQASSKEITFSAGELKLASGASGDMVSKIKNMDSVITEAYLLVSGEVLDDAVFKVRAVDGINYQTIARDGRITFTTSGTQITLLVTLNSTNVRIRSISLGLK